MKFIRVLALIALAIMLAVPGVAECSGGKTIYRYECTSQFGGCRLVPVKPAPAAPSPTAAPTSKPVVTKAPAATSRPVATKAPAASNNGSLASQVIAQVNAERAKNGLGELKSDKTLTDAACVRAKEIVSSFSHTRPDGSSWSTVSSKAYGENIAKGYSTADKVMAAWLTSQGHRENILRSSYTTIGVCAYEYNGVVYWVQLFGRG